VRLGWRLLLWFGIALVVGALTGALFQPLGLVGGSLAILIGAWVAGTACLSLDGRGSGALGFYLAPSVPGEVARGLSVGVALAVIVVGAIALTGGLAWSGDMGSIRGWIGGAVGAAALLAIPAASEEALLRGYPLQAMTEAWGPGWGLGVTSLAFGALHLPNPDVTVLGAANTAAAGVFLGVVYLRTGSLWWAAAAHLGWNWGIGWLADLPVSGLELLDAPLVEGVARGPAWWSGGAFGPEGSVVATLGFLGAAAVLWRVRWLGPGSAALARRPLVFAGRDGGEEHDGDAGVGGAKTGMEEG
jgi:membrane protease YdiL (CAAX protease family)